MTDQEKIVWRDRSRQREGDASGRLHAGKCGILANMEKLATDIYTFDNLVRYGFTYIDKTDRLWPLVNLSVGKQFFIAPRTWRDSL